MDEMAQASKSEKKQISWSLRRITLGPIVILCAYLNVQSMFVSHVSLNLQGKSGSFKPPSTRKTTTSRPDLRPFCKPEDLEGELNPDFDPQKLDERFQNMSNQYEQYFVNGEHNPKDCKVERLKKIAIICPLRDETNQMRTKQFLYLLNYLIPMPRLHRQNIHFGIYLIIQSNDGHPFNKGRVMNAGFDIAKKDGFECMFFHDVDLVPENDKNIYECFDYPRHYSGYIDKWNYTIPFHYIYGGITAYSVEAFENINGFSNEYWGWGGEDDDMIDRTELGSGYDLVRPPEEFTHYKMIEHEHEKSNAKNPLNQELVKNWAWHMATDGINNLKYDILEEKIFPLYKNYTIDVKYEERMPIEKLIRASALKRIRKKEWFKNYKNRT